MKHGIVLVIGAGLLMAGCCSNSSEKLTLERGWIGGEYKTAQRMMVPKGQNSRVYVKQIYAGTPADSAGLKAGDLILTVNGQNVTRPKDFHSIVDASVPGSRASIQVWRDGESLELPVTVGRERYKQWHAISLGLHLSTQFDLWPDPDFALAPLARYKTPDERVELHSPEVILRRQAGDESSQGETGARSDEGWDAWFLIFGVNAHKRILSQDAVEATSRQSEAALAAKLF
jgi:hypothetical protein